MRGVDFFDTTTVHYELHSSDGSGCCVAPQGRELPAMMRSVARSMASGLASCIGLGDTFAAARSTDGQATEAVAAVNYGNALIRTSLCLLSFSAPPFQSSVHWSVSPVHIFELPKHTQDFLHSLYALHTLSVTMPIIPSRLRCLQMVEREEHNVLEVIHAHGPVTSIAPEAFEAPVCGFLARVEVLAVPLALSSMSVKSRKVDWGFGGWEAVPGELGLALGPGGGVFAGAAVALGRRHGGRSLCGLQG